MPSLRELQQAVRRSLAQGDGRDAARYVIGDGLAPRQRLNIHRNNFVGTLSNALRLSFPAVHRLVGAAFFEGAAQIFMQERPPRSAYLDAYGAEFPEFLQRFAPAATLVYLADVARLEWAVNRALHAPDAVPLHMARLAGLALSEHARVCLVAHPSLSTIRSDFPVDAIWRAVLSRDDAAVSAIDLAAGPVWLMVQRLATGVDVTRLDEAAWHFAAGMCAGRPLGAVLAAADGIEAPALLAEHLTAGRFVDFHLADCEAADQRKESAP